MPRSGHAWSERSRKLLSATLKRKCAEEGFRPGETDHGWSDTAKDEEAMRRWR